MRIRRWLAGSVAVALAALSVAACSDSGSDDGPKVGMAYDIGGRGDRSFNDSAAAGLDRAKKNLDIRAQEVSPNKDGTDRGEKLKQLVENGFNPVIAVGLKYGPDVEETAKQNPDTTFAIVDEEVSGDNVVSILFNAAEGSYLVGMAAALKTQSKHVGFVGGVDDTLIHAFANGFQQGVAAVDPNITVDVTYLTSPPDYSGFSAPASAKVAANGLYDGGADIIYQAAGNSGPGVFQAAVEQRKAGKDVWAIGVDQDQHKTASEDEKEVILTSMIKRTDVGVYDFIKRFQNGERKGRVLRYDLADGGVDYATSGGFIDDIKPQLDKAKQDIIDGKITVNS